MSIMKDYNYIKQIAVMQCSIPNPWVYVETALPSATLALLTLGQPGCTDIVKTKLGLSPWHTRKVKALLKGAAAPFSAEATQFLWKIGYFEIEKYLWWFMVADTAKEFLLTWQTMVFQVQQCDTPGNGTAYGYPSVLLYTPSVDQGVGIAALHLVSGVAVGGNIIQIAAGLDASVVMNIEWDSWPIRGKGTNVTTWMTVTGDDTPLNVTNTLNQPAGLQTQSVIHTYKNNPLYVRPTQYHFWARNEGDELIQIVGGSWNVSTMGRRNGLTSFGCNLKPVTWPFP